MTKKEDDRIEAQPPSPLRNKISKKVIEKEDDKSEATFGVLGVFLAMEDVKFGN